MSAKVHFLKREKKTILKVFQIKWLVFKLDIDTHTHIHTYINNPHPYIYIYTYVYINNPHFLPISCVLKKIPI